MGLKHSLKRLVHLKMKILSSFTHPQVVSKLYEFFSSAEHKSRYFNECQETESWWTPLTFIVVKTYSTMEVNGVHQQF